MNSSCFGPRTLSNVCSTSPLYWALTQFPLRAPWQYEKVHYFSRQYAGAIAGLRDDCWLLPDVQCLEPAVSLFFLGFVLLQIEEKSDPYYYNLTRSTSPDPLFFLPVL